jgi:GNAT superfamily N-acetyltransferase
VNVLVRPALAGERFAILGLARAFHEASGVDLPFSAAQASVSVAQCIDEKNRLCLVAVSGSSVVGFLLAGVSQGMFSDLLISQELAFFVSPCARGWAAFRLLDAYEAWAVSQGCGAIGLACLGDARVAKLYARRGFRPVENHFIKVVS